MMNIQLINSKETKMKKSPLLFLLGLTCFMFLAITTQLTAQTETFESGETDLSQNFSQGGIDFISTGDLRVVNFINFGANSSNWYMDSDYANQTNGRTVGSIQIQNASTSFTITSFAGWTGENQGFKAGDVTFNGTLAAGGTATEVVTITPTNNTGTGWDTGLTFTGALSGAELTALEIVLPGDLDYISLDDIAFTTAPIVINQYSISDVTMAEGNGAGTVNFNFTITRTDNTNAGSVQVQSADNSATTVDNDYTAFPLTTINFLAAGATTQTVTVTVQSDNDIEGTEDFFMNLSNPTGGTILDPQGVGTIVEDDEICEDYEDETDETQEFSENGFNFTTTGDLEVEYGINFGAGGSDFWLGTVAGNGGSSGSVGLIQIANIGTSFNITKVDAWVGNDDGNNPTAGDLTFRGHLAAGGTTDHTVNINASGNNFVSVDFSGSPLDGQQLLSIELIIASGLNYVSLDNFKFGTGTVTSAQVSVSDVNKLEGTGGGSTTFEFEVTRTNNLTAFTVDIASSAITATAGTDYTTVPTTQLSFAVSGPLTQTVNVIVAADSDIEPNETFQMTLSNVSAGAVIQDGIGIGKILDDDSICETFEDETATQTTFIESGVEFSSTGDLFVENVINFGSGPSNFWLGTGTGDGNSSGSVGKIQVTSANTGFRIIQIDAWTGTDDGNTHVSGDVTFTGTLAIGGTVSETITVTPTGTTGSDYDNISFVGTTLENAVLTDLEFTIVGSGIFYVALDNFCFEAISLCDLAVSGPSDPATIEGCSSADVQPTSSLAFSTTSAIITQAQFIAEGGSITTSSNITSISYQDVATGVGVHPIVVTRTFTVVDDCPNTKTVTQTFTIEDNTPPTIPTCPPMRTVEGCTTADITNHPNISLGFNTSSTLITSTQFSTEGGTWADNCTPQRSITYQDAAAGTCPIVVTRTFTVEDFGFNTVQCQQTINIDDTTDPVISGCPANVGPLSMDPGGCGATVTWAAPTATDNCGGMPSISQVAGDPSGTTFPEGTHTVQYSATDACMNVSLCTFTIEVLGDSEDPTANCPGNITVGNDAGLCGANVTFNATVSDNCPSATIACSAMSGDFFAVGTTTVNCVAVDAAGNTATCSFDITVNDTQKPTANCPVNISTNVDPGQCTATVNYGAASAVDNCPGPTFSCSPVSGSSFNVGVTTVTCTATDAAGNTANCTFNVTVIDNQGPTANCPGNQTVNVASGTCAANVSWTASASDNCPGPSVSCSPASGSSFGVGVTPVTCTATDASGNTANCTFNVTVIDNQGPTAICHGDTTVVNDAGLCGATVSFSIPDPTDNCPGATSSANPASGSFFAVGTNPVTVTATDAAGNTGICSFNVTVNDTQKPTANCPANITVGTDPGQCNAVVIYSSSASDNCPGATVICAPASGSSFGVGTTTVTCTATDASGNTGGCTFTVTVNDNEDPTPNCNTTSVNLDMAPGTHTFSQAEIDAMGAGSTDNCGSVTFSANPTSVSCADGSSATVALTVDDGNGNSSMCNATVNINDPNSFCCQFTATCPMNTGLGTFDCSTLGSIPALPVDQAGAAAPPYNITFGANPCGTILVSASDDASPNVCGGTVQNITRTVFTWDDLPGGTPGVFDAGTEDSHTCTYTYTVNPDGAPSAVCPSIPDVELDANGNGSLPANIGGGLSTDDCGTPTETSPQQLYTCADIGPQTVTLTATDACNNMDTENCSFNVVDNTDPVITCPANVTKECDQSTSSTWTGTATATDNCSASPTISESDATAPGSCANEWTITRTWTADDGNGNTATCDQTINVVDSQGPAITCPAAVTVECDADHSPASTGSATALDNCDTQPAIASSDAASAGTCAQEWTITRTWTATDACGNSNSCDQVITVEDSTAPTISCPPDVTVECGADNTSASTGTATATDNCSAVGDIAITESDNFAVGSCANASTITRTWTATDECGNPSSCGQTVTVEDSQGPTVSCPANTTVECNEDNTSANTGTATATDNCSAVGGITIGESDATTPGSCANEWTVTRTWTATDECGQSSSCDQTINVEDSTGPAMSCGALTVTPSSGGTYTLSQTEIDGLGAGSTDNCGSVTFTAAPSSFNCADEGANNVTVTGTDECGNSSSCTATVTVTAYLTVNSCTATDESCTGAGDGTITVSATALGGQVKYSIDGGTNFSASGNFTNLTPATYNIVVKVFGIAEICEKTDTKAVAAGGTAQVWHKDADGDGYSDGNTLTSCTQPTGYIASPLAGTDCNDADPAINPGATEACNGLDDDCDGIVPADEQDNDGDGYMVCENDCDDTDPDVNPGATEICNGIDDDCDGDIDEGVSSGETFTGNVTLASQADVDAWQACYSKIDGNLTISGYNISNLGPLINIEEVTGSVSIFYNGSSLTSLDGLDNLATVGGSLSIFYNFSLSDCCALYNLINGGVTGTISIFFNATGCNSTSEINSNCNPSPLVQNPNGISFEPVETGRKPSVALFPNPVSGELSVAVNNFGNVPATLAVTDNMGRSVILKEIGELESELLRLDTSNLPTGVYSLSIRATGMTPVVKRFVKMDQ